MRKFVPILITVLVAGVSWIFFSNFKIAGLDDVRVAPRGAQETEKDDTESPLQGLRDKVTQLVDAPPKQVTENAAPTVIPDAPPRIRVATFRIQSFSLTKVQKPHVLDILARIGRQFDVLAIQQIHSDTDNILPRLVHLMNKTGQQYDYAIGPRVGPEEDQEQYGFVFNRRTVELDRKELYTVDDRDNLLSYEPFVAWFRAVGPPPAEAFTFSVINLRIDPRTRLQELEYLDDVLFAVREDGRQEDDIILAGDLQSQPADWAELARVSDLGYAINHLPTNVEATRGMDNLVFQKTATSEYTGNSGVFDFLRQFNLTLDQALEVSDHLPVWAEFSIIEGGEAGRVASEAGLPQR